MIDQYEVCSMKLKMKNKTNIKVYDISLQYLLFFSSPDTIKLNLLKTVKTLNNKNVSIFKIYYFKLIIYIVKNKSL